jgi:hypothetical protein
MSIEVFVPKNEVKDFVNSNVSCYFFHVKIIKLVFMAHFTLKVSSTLFIKVVPLGSLNCLSLAQIFSYTGVTW